MKFNDLGNDLLKPIDTTEIKIIKTSYNNLLSAKLLQFFLSCLFILTLVFQHNVYADDFEVVEKIVSISQKDGKKEFTEGTDKTITYTVTLSCPVNTVECTASTCASTEAACSNECSPNRCLNGAECVDDVDDFTCACLPGYSGENCEINIDECAVASGEPPRCSNGGTCTDGVNAFTCECTPEFTGDSCQASINDCLPGACLNGGSCVDGKRTVSGVPAYSCQCPSGWTGGTCEEDINECEVANGGCNEFQMCENRIGAPRNCIDVTPELDKIADQSVTENDLVNFKAIAAIPEGGGSPIYSLDDGKSGSVPTGASIDANSGIFSWQTGEADGPDAYKFIVIAKHNKHESLVDSQEVSITVFESNEPPIIDPISDTSIEAGTKLVFTATALREFTVTATDPDLPKNEITFSIDSTSESKGMRISASKDTVKEINSGEEIVVSGSVLSWKPAKYHVGTHSVTITAKDNGNPPLNDAQTISIDVRERDYCAEKRIDCGKNGQCEINDDGTTYCQCDVYYEGKNCDILTPPSGGTVSAVPTKVESGGITDLVAKNWQAVVPAPDISYSWSAQCDGGIGTGTFPDGAKTATCVDRYQPCKEPSNNKWTAPTNNTGKDQKCTITVEIKDLRGATTTATVDVEVKVENQPPVIKKTIASIKLNEDSSYKITLTEYFSDPDADELTYTNTDATNGVVSIESSELTYTPNPNFNGEDKFTITASDGESSVPQEVQVKVESINDAPVLVKQIPKQNIKEVEKLEKINVSQYFSDPDIENKITFSIDDESIAKKMYIDPSTGKFSWSPTAADYGTHSVTITAQDNGSPPLAVTETVAIEVIQPNLIQGELIAQFDKIQAGKPLTFSAEGWKSKTDSSLSYAWASSPNDEEQCAFSKPDDQKVITLTTPKYGDVDACMVTVTVTDEGDKSTGSATKSVSILYPPSGGSISVSPTTVNSGEGVTVTASEWLSNTKEPLSYSFSAKCDDKVWLISDFANTSSTEWNVPAGIGNEQICTLTVEVKDAYGLTATASTTIEVKSTTTSSVSMEMTLQGLDSSNTCPKSKPEKCADGRCLTSADALAEGSNCLTTIDTDSAQ